MLKRLQHRAHGQEGFTLIELLVVILIIGILAAVAIPTFLSQTSKAYDSNAQSALNSAQNAEATYQTSNGNYTAASTDVSSTNPLIAIEPTLASPFATSGNVNSMKVVLVGTTGYTVTDFSPKSGSSGITYSLTYSNANGSLTKSCWAGNVASSQTALLNGRNIGGCNNNNTW